jgi:L-threonylcarbamoyladenylate synthase
METLHLDASNPADVQRAATLLAAGKLVAIPTETVYGLAARVFAPSAVEEIFRVKGRPLDNPLIVHCALASDIERVATDIPHVAWRVLERFAPGPLTLVLHRHPRVPSIVSAGLPSVAVRIPALDATRRLIALVGEPVVAPSANRSGRPSPTCAEHVFDDLGGTIAAVLDAGPCAIGIESTVLNLTAEPATIVRPGAIEAVDLAEILGYEPPIAYHSGTGAPIAPGMKYRHYAPRTPVFLTSSLETIPSGVLVLTTAQVESDRFRTRPLTRQTLYDEFRRADREHVPAIYVLITPDVRADRALMNRLEKASVSALRADDIPPMS